MAAKTGAGPRARGGQTFKDKEKPTEVRFSNIIAAKGQSVRTSEKSPDSTPGRDTPRSGDQTLDSVRGTFPPQVIPCLGLFAAVADAIRTSLGPRGMDKMVSLCSFPVLAALNCVSFPVC